MKLNAKQQSLIHYLALRAPIYCAFEGEETPLWLKIEHGQGGKYALITFSNLAKCEGEEIEYHDPEQGILTRKDQVPAIYLTCLHLIEHHNHHWHYLLRYKWRQRRKLRKYALRIETNRVRRQTLYEHNRLWNATKMIVYK